MKLAGSRARRSPAVLLGMAVAVGGAAPARAQAPSLGDATTAFYELGGLTILHRLRPASGVVVVRLYLLGGTRQLTLENAGIEVLLLRAAALERGRGLDRTGARPVLEATPDWTVTGFIGLRMDLDSAWSGFARQLERPTFSEASLDRARGELLALARRRYTEPDLRIRAGAQQAAFRGHPYALDPEGTVASLTSLSPADIERYWEDRFVTSRMLLVVVGAVTRYTLDSLVGATLGRLPRGSYVWTLPPAVPSRPSSWVREHQMLPTSYILGYFEGPIPTDPDYFPFRIAVALLSSKLAVLLREREPLSYAAYAPWFDYAVPAGGVYASTSRPGDAIVAIRRALSDVQTSVPSGSEPAGWKRFFDGFALHELVARLTSDGQAESLARAYLYFGDPAMADEFVPRLRGVRYWSLAKVARRYMQDIQLAYMGDTALMHGRW